MGQQEDWCSRRSTQVNTSYYLGQSSYLGRNISIQFNYVLQKLMCFSFNKNNKQTKKPVNCFLQDDASAGIQSLQVSVEQRRRKMLSSGGDRITAWGLGGAVSSPAGPGQSPDGGPGGEAPRSSAIFRNSA